MTFTDEDLKRLKNTSAIHIDCEDINKCLVRPITAKECMALLTRLEAAEFGVFSLETVIRWMRQEERYKTLSAADLVWLQGAENSLEVWRKAAGK